MKAGSPSVCILKVDEFQRLTERAHMIGMRPEVANDLANNVMKAAGFMLTGSNRVPGPADRISCHPDYDMTFLPVFAGQRYGCI